MVLLEFITFEKWILVLEISIVLSFIWIAAYLQRSSKTWHFGLKIPGPTPLPFIGNALMLTGKSNTEIVKFV